MEIRIERILPGGMGLGHAEGKTVLVSLAAPGDRLRVQVERTQGNVLFASVVEILAPSPVRVDPPCPYFGRCGGCDFQQLTYEAQLAAKTEIIRDCLQRIARLDEMPEFMVHPSPYNWRYRVRATWQIDREQQRDRILRARFAACVRRGGVCSVAAAVAANAGACAGDGVE